MHIAVPMGSLTPTTGGGSGSSFKRADVLDAMQALCVSDDLQDAVALALASTRVVTADVLRGVLRGAGVPARVALRVEDKFVSVYDWGGGVQL